MLGRDVLIGWICMIVSIALAGCRGDSCCQCPVAVTGPVDIEPRAPRGSLQVDASDLRPVDEVESDRPAEYRHLTPDECQCLAAHSAPLASVMELERSSGSRHKSSGDAAQSFTRRLTRIRTVNERNRAAAEALKVYYQLAEAEGKRDLLAQSLAKIDDSIRQEGELRKQGIAAPSRGALATERLGMLSARTKLDASISQLNGKLRVILHLDEHDLTPIWPKADLTMGDDGIDVDEAISEGLALRPDLAALRLMRDSVNADTLPVIQQSMQMMGATLSVGGKLKTHLLKPSARQAIQDEIHLRRRQLFQLYSDAERAATEEIRQAAIAVDTARRLVALSAEKANQLKSRNEDLKRLREAGEATPQEIARGSLDILTADADLLHDVIQWKLALAKLHEAQGQLAADCGYVAPCRICP